MLDGGRWGGCKRKEKGDERGMKRGEGVRITSKNSLSEGPRLV